MPKIQLGKTSGSIVYDQDDWLAGLNTMSTNSENQKMKGNPSMSNVSVLRQYGFIAPSLNPVNVTNASQITAFLRNAVNVADNAYIIESDSLVQKLTTLGNGTISTTAPFPHTIDHAHANEAGNDIALYYTGTTQRVFFSFSDATDWDVGIYNVVADTFDDDFMSTVPASPLAAPYLAGGQGYPHPIVVGDDDILYIGDRNFVHAYDGQTGANGTFYPAVLTLPQGFIITCFTTTQDLQLAIGAYLTSSSSASTFNRGSAKVWFWNYLALDPDYSRDLRDNYVSELIQWAGTTAAFTSGRRTLSDKGVNKLQALQGSQFQVVKTWSDGGLPIRGGVDNVGDDLYWNATGSIYAYTKKPDTGQYMLNIIGSNANTSSGLLKFFTASGIIHISSGSGTNGGLAYLASDYAAGGALLTQIAVPEFNVRTKGRLKSVTIAFSGTFTGGRSFELVTNQDGATVLTTGVITSITNTRKLQLVTNSDGSPLGDFNYLQAQIGFPTGSGASTAPLVSWIRYDFDIVNA